VHPDWSRLARIVDEVSGQSFEASEMGRAFGEMLRSVGIEMGREGFVLPDEMKRPHWTFRRMFTAMGLDAGACDLVMIQLAAAHVDRHVWCGPDPEAASVLDKLKQQGLLLAVISNTEDGRLIESLEAAGIADRFDLLIDSHLAAFVGDSYVHDALAAQAVGLRGILLDPLDLHPESVCPRIKSLEELVGI
jgi:FMN phosphatase YigB (HAD superfamily)